MVFFCTIIFFGFIKIFQYISRCIQKKYLSTITLSQIDAMDGYDFEKYVKVLLSTKGIKVETTRERQDYGADLIIRHHRLRVVMQCKLYYKHGVGVSAVQEIHTAIPYYKADYGVVLTNSHFTPSATALASNSGVILLGRAELLKLSKTTTSRKDVLQIICQNLS